MDNIKMSISASNNGTPSGLRFEILYTSIYRELQSVPDKDANINYGDVIAKLRDSFDNIISELSEEQACINKHMKVFKASFKEIDFVKLSEDFLKSSVENKIDMLIKYCELSIALEKSEIVTDKFDLKWFARDLIDSIPRKSHDGSDDELNNDDDDAFLLYYLNEVNKNK